MWRRGVVGLLLAAGLLSGCTGDDEGPSTVPSVTSTPSVTESATPTAAPTTPGVITAEQAVAAATGYFTMLTQVAQEGVGQERFEALLVPSCAPCSEQAQRLRSLTAGGQRVVGGDIQIVDSSVDSLAADTALVKVGTQALPGAVVDASGATVTPLPAEAVVDQVMTVVLTGNGPLIADIADLGERGG